MSIFNLAPNQSRAPGFFCPENIEYLCNTLTETLKREYRGTVKFTRASVVRAMQRIHEERVETVPQMNQRVLIDLLRIFRNEMEENNRINGFWDNDGAWKAWNYDPFLGIQQHDSRRKMNLRTRPLRFRYTF